MIPMDGFYGEEEGNIEGQCGYEHMNEIGNDVCWEYIYFSTHINYCYYPKINVKIHSDPMSLADIQ